MVSLSHLPLVQMSFHLIPMSFAVVAGTVAERCKVRYVVLNVCRDVSVTNLSLTP